MITILGLGPGAVDHLTMRAWEKIQNTATLYLRTARHPCVADLPANCNVASFDDVYQKYERFEHVYEEIAARIIRLARDQGRGRLRRARGPAGRRGDGAAHY